LPRVFHQNFLQEKRLFYQFQPVSNPRFKI
jgi:hypothetical protein